MYSAEGWLDVTAVGRDEAQTKLVDTLERRASIEVDVREIGTTAE
ncbi:hypothetical protein [Halopelagius longus]|nr:hypothetical protein [Halopelagius longus]